MVCSDLSLPKIVRQDELDSTINNKAIAPEHSDDVNEQTEIVTMKSNLPQSSIVDGQESATMVLPNGIQLVISSKSIRADFLIYILYQYAEAIVSMTKLKQPPGVG